MKLRRIVCLLLCLLLPAGLSPAALAAGEAYRCSSWAEEEMAEAVTLGFVPADLLGDCTRPVTRRDYARVALRFTAWLQYGYPGETALFVQAYCASGGLEPAAPFADAPEEELTWARSVGLVQGRSETEFDPDSGITRQEAALILRRAYAAYADPAAVAGSSDYADGELIASWAKEGVDFVTAAGVMQGVGEGKFDPLGAYTVEQCVLTFLRLYKSAPVSRAKGNVEPLLSVEELTELILSREMGGVPLRLSGKTELPGCTVLSCGYSGFTQPLEYLYVVYAEGGVRDFLAALRTTWDVERWTELGDLESWSYAIAEDGSSMTLHGEYASGAAADVLCSLEGNTVADPWEELPAGAEEADAGKASPLRSYRVLETRRLGDTGARITGLLASDDGSMNAVGEDGSLFIWGGFDFGGPGEKSIQQAEWEERPVSVSLSRFELCCVDAGGVLWTGLRGRELTPKLTGAVYGEAYLHEGLAVTADGRLLLWYGEEEPVPVMENVRSASRFGSILYVICADGSLWRLEGFGLEERTILTDPRPEKLLEDVVQTGGPLALKEDGTVWSLAALEPRRVFDDAVSVHSDGVAFAAIRTGGELWCWGTFHRPGSVTDSVTLENPSLCCEDAAQAVCCYDGVLILRTDGSLLTLSYDGSELILEAVE